MTGSPWVIEFDGLVPAEEGRREALCTLGNGVFASRGAAAESRADGIHYPGTYAAGLYNRLISEVHGRVLEHESVPNLPNWLVMTLRVDDEAWLGEPGAEVADQHLSLDLREGILNRRFSVTDPSGRITAVRERRLVSMDSPHLAALEWSITPQNWEGSLSIRSLLDGGVENRNVADERELSGRHLQVIAAGEGDPGTCWLEVETVQSHHRCAEAARVRIVIDDQMAAVPLAPYRNGDAVGYEATIPVRPGETVVVEKVVALFTGLDRAISEPRSAAVEALAIVGGFDDLAAAHRVAWRQLWEQHALALDDADPDAARILNLHIFHVLQTLSPHTADRDAGVGPRGLHGEGYRGHIFWDELFIFPFLNMRTPQLTRALLLYRYRRLPAARRAAADVGQRGAMFPWQSGSDGREETPTQFFNPVSQRWMADNSRRQRHVGLAVAYNVWQYYTVSADTDFLATYGAEMLVEISRFFLSLAHYDEADDRFHIRGVMGPDEFHDGYPDRPGEGIDDNAYTNVMVSWLLQITIDAHRLLSGLHTENLWERLGVTPEEIADWDRVSRRLAVPFFDGGIIAQFAGYEYLADLDWEAYRRRFPNIGRLDLILEAEGDNTNCYQLSKQPDVLMLLYLFSADELTMLLDHLGYEFDPEVIPETIEFYLARTTNGSTLSRVAHAWVLARYDRERSWQTFLEALVSDVADIQGGTTPEGIHLGAMAGTIDLVQRCYMGIEPRGDVLWFDPTLPEDLDTIGLTLRYRGHWLDVLAADGTLQVSLRPSEAAPVHIGLIDHVVEVGPGESVSIAIVDPSG